VSWRVVLHVLFSDHGRMPFIARTPESLLARSDSKNPAATCCGLTANGRPCRRAISRVACSVPILGPEAYCWQHKGQYVHTSPHGLQHDTVPERTSVDSLVDRLGLLEVGNRKKRRENVSDSEKWKTGRRDSGRPKPKPKPRKPRSTFVLLCGIGEVEQVKAPRPVRPKPRSTVPKAGVPGETPQRPKIYRGPSSGELLSLIPSSVPPQTTALLLAELAKPVSEFDEEGYIYMFWLTPESLPSAPPSEVAPSLLSPPETSRRTSDVLDSFASTSSNTKTILLKIGRTQNVQRRLNQWSRQCGYNLSLIRYYPYHPSLSSTSVDAPSTPRRVPNVHKVERLIHLELASKRAQGSGRCSACGKEHREWFEVEARRKSIKVLDDVVRRWVDWGERQR
jgi:hypothetical protein